MLEIRQPTFISFMSSFMPCPCSTHWLRDWQHHQQLTSFCSNFNIFLCLFTSNLTVVVEVCLSQDPPPSTTRGIHCFRRPGGQERGVSPGTRCVWVGTLRSWWPCSAPSHPSPRGPRWGRWLWLALWVWPQCLFNYCLKDYCRVNLYLCIMQISFLIFFPPRYWLNIMYRVWAALA